MSLQLCEVCEDKVSEVYHDSNTGISGHKKCIVGKRFAKGTVIEEDHFADKVPTYPISDIVLPIDEYEKLYFPNLSGHIATHVNNYVKDDEDQYHLKRMIFMSLREYIEAFDSRETIIPCIGLDNEKMCASRYRKISRQVSKMGGWANFEHYINKTFVNEANEYNRLAMFVEKVSLTNINLGAMKRLKGNATKLIKGLK